MFDDDRKALVLFSGGQDSTTCLAWALQNYDYVETVGINYGQRHSVELECRQRILQLFKQTPSLVEYSNTLQTYALGDDHLLDLSVLGQISETSLTSVSEIQMTAKGLPSTFVPGRNLLFFTLASAIAFRRGFNVVVGGMCETDFSGYPDCRRDVINDLQDAITGGMNHRIELVTPLMYLTKAQTWQLAEKLGGSNLINLIRYETHTCYKGHRDFMFEWGYGCGECPACEIRKKGYADYISKTDSVPS